jgi:hypothetical protein
MTMTTTTANCPDCGTLVTAYDDQPWPEGHEWTSAYQCRCGALWTTARPYPTSRIPDAPDGDVTRGGATS